MNQSDDSHGGAQTLKFRRRFVFPWEKGAKGPGAGRYCDECAYFPKDIDGALCLRCGRYVENKFPEILIAAVALLSLALFSNYILTGRVFRGTNTLWLNTGLQFPYSAYASAEYRHAVIFALAGLAALPALFGFHYGARTGLAAGVLAGFFSGVPWGVFAFSGAAWLASLKGRRHVAVFAWPVLATLATVLFYAWLVRAYGPTNRLYRAALYNTVFIVGEFALLVTLLEILSVSWMNFRSWPVIPFAVFAAAGPMAVFAAGVGRPAFEAERIFAIYNPAKTLEGELPVGLVAGLSDSKRPDLSPGGQARRAFETARYVDTIRSVAVGAADAHVRKFPRSPYVPEMLLFKAMMYNARVDFAELTQAGRLETYFDRISPEALPVYGEIASKYAATAYGALARFETARGIFQSGRVLEAQPLIDKCVRDLAQYVPKDYGGGETPEPESVKELLSMPDPRPTKLAARVHQAMIEARELSSLIADNLDYAGQPLERLAALDLRSADFERAARELLTAYPRSKLVDNVRFMLAKKILYPAERASAMRALLDGFPESDIRDALLYERAYALYLANLTGRGAAEAKPLLDELRDKYPQSTYNFRAVALLGKVNVAVALDAGASPAR